MMPKKPRKMGQNSSGRRKGSTTRAKRRPAGRPTVAKKGQQNLVAPRKADTAAGNTPIIKEDETQEPESRESQRSAAEEEELKQRAAAVAESKSYRDIQRLLWKRWRNLVKNKEFVWETMQLKYRLTEAYLESPDVMNGSFNPTFNVAAPQLRSVEEKIDGVPNEKVWQLLRQYARYAVRYGVAFTLLPKSPYFRVRATGFIGDKFRVVIRNGQIEPFVTPLSDDSPYEDAPLADAFGSDEPIPPAVEALMRGREYLARYVVIDDTEDFSQLRQLMDFAYSPNQVTVDSLQFNSAPDPSCGR